jgi:hypothetical protein
VAPKFLHNPKNYLFDFEHTELIYSVLIDNGIDDEGAEFFKIFPNAKVIKICYSDQTWPVVASAMIHKAMHSTLDYELSIDPTNWQTTEVWAQREKYFLFLKEHHYRDRWREHPGCHNIFIEDFFNYDRMSCVFDTAGIKLTNFSDLWQQWWDSNQTYIKPLKNAQDIMTALDHHQHIDLDHCSDLWTQAIVNYLIWTKHNYIVPANDYSNWFANTGQILSLLHHA